MAGASSSIRSIDRGDDVIEQVGIWPASEESEEFKLAYINQSPGSPLKTTMSLGARARYGLAFNEIFTVARFSSDALRLNEDVLRA